MQSSNRFTAYSSYLIELKLGKMILDISPRKLDELDFSPGGAVGTRLLETPNRFTAYSSHTIELKLGMMVLDISPLDRSTSDFSVPPGGAVATRLLKFSIRFTAYSIEPIELKLGMIIIDINPHTRYKQGFFGAGERLVICTCFLVLAAQKSLSLPTNGWALFSKHTSFSRTLMNNLINNESIQYYVFGQ